MERAELELLLQPGTLALIDRAMAMDSAQDAMAQVVKLRAEGHSPDLVATVLNQVKLRRRASQKFSEFADRMLFSEEGLEQATRLQISALHAHRFRAAGIKAVADLGCGIGSDSMAFASLGLQVSAFDVSEVSAALASYNLAVFPEAKVSVADITKLDLETFDALWFDPARRDLQGPKKLSHKRVEPKDFSPALDFVFEWAAKKPTGVKLGPGVDHELIPEGAEAQWVSHNGDLVELTLWFGSLRRTASRSALMVASGKQHVFDGEVVQAQVSELKRYVYEPDSSLIRSHLLGDFANQHGLTLVSKDIAYLTSDELIDSPWLKAFEVIDVLSLDEKQIRKYLAEKQIGIVEIKKRGVDVTPEELRKKLRLKGTGAATLILTKLGDARKTLVVKPIR